MLHNSAGVRCGPRTVGMQTEPWQWEMKGGIGHVCSMQGREMRVGGLQHACMHATRGCEGADGAGARAVSSAGEAGGDGMPERGEHLCHFWKELGVSLDRGGRHRGGSTLALEASKPTHTASASLGP